MLENHIDNRRLDSWKEIAAYLNKDVRTVIRWEKDRGLPVHRVPGGRRKGVFAYQHELQAWLGQGDGQRAITAERSKKSEKSEAVPAKGRPILKYCSLFTAIASVALLAYWLITSHQASAHGVPTRVEFTANAIQAFDDQSHLIWTHSFAKTLDLDGTFHKETLKRLARIEDLAGDGEKEVFVTIPLRAGPNPGDGDLTEVDCFSSQGKLLWSYIPEKTFRFGSHELGGPWYPLDVFVSRKGPKHAVWVTFGHHEWGNSFVVQLDPVTGNDTVRFVNTGVIYTLNEVTTSKGSYLLAGGFNNEYAAGSLAVIDESGPFAVSPQTDGTRHKCLSCPEGAPAYYFVFPRSEINRLLNVWEDSVRYIDVSGGEFEIWKAETVGSRFEMQSNARTIYLFHTQPAPQPFALRFDSDYDMLHRSLEKERKLDHSLDSCPERLHSEPVRVWTKSSGWEAIDLKP
jgi:hypothetical protein